MEGQEIIQKREWTSEGYIVMMDECFWINAPQSVTCWPTLKKQTENQRTKKGGGGGGGRSGTYEELVQAPQHAKTEETVSHHQNNNVKEVGTPPVRSNLCTSLIAVSAAARAEQSHKDSVRKATVEEQLSSKTINPSSYDSPAPPPSSWSLLGS